MGRALRETIDESKIVIVGEDIVEKIRMLFPQADLEMLNDADAEPQIESIDREALFISLVKELRKLPRFSGAGALGTLNEHLMSLA